MVTHSSPPSQKSLESVLKSDKTVKSKLKCQSIRIKDVFWCKRHFGFLEQDLLVCAARNVSVLPLFTTAALFARSQVSKQLLKSKHSRWIARIFCLSFNSRY